MNPTTTIEHLKVQKTEFKKKNEELKAKLKWFEEQFSLSQQRKFGSFSEKNKINLNSLF